MRVRRAVRSKPKSDHMIPDEVAHAVALHKCLTDPFTRGYLACALWSSHDESTPEGGEPFDRKYSESDFAASALRQAFDECQAFQEANEPMLAIYRQTCTGGDGNPYETAGHDFWLTRNRHGAGFWDRDAVPEDAQTALTNAAHAAGERNPYLGDDGKIYFA